VDSWLGYAGESSEGSVRYGWAGQGIQDGRVRLG